MKYQLKICPVCGSDNLAAVAVETEGEDEYVCYRCLACDESVKAKPTVAQPKIAKKIVAFSGRDVFEKNKDSIVLLSSQTERGTSCGSGFVISDDGFVVTNAHVVADMNNSTANLGFDLNSQLVGAFDERGGDQLDVVNVDLKRDLALLKFAEGNRKWQKVQLGDYARLGSGDVVYAMGNSKGEGLTITSGIVSDRSRVYGGFNYIMTDTAVNHGNSGGPLFDATGKVVGVVVMSIKDADRMNGAIPIDDVVAFVKRTEELEEISIL